MNTEIRILVRRLRQARVAPGHDRHPVPRGAARAGVPGGRPLPAPRAGRARRADLAPLRAA